MTRDDAVQRTLATLRFFANAPHGPETDATGHKGFYYHFLDMKSGRRAWRRELSSVDGSALTIALAYIAGGFIPLGPYIALKATMALPVSVGVTLLALAIFGYVKGHFTGASPLRSSLQTVLIGGLAAAAAFLIARAIS